MPTLWPFPFQMTDPLPDPVFGFLLGPTSLLHPHPTSNEARRQRPDYLHWPGSVCLGRLPQHSCTGSHWHIESQEEGGSERLAPVSRPSEAGWWMSRTARSLPPNAAPLKLQWVTVSRLAKLSPAVPLEPELDALLPSTNIGGLSLTGPILPDDTLLLGRPQAGTGHSLHI